MKMQLQKKNLNKKYKRILFQNKRLRINVQRLHEESIEN